MVVAWLAFPHDGMEEGSSHLLLDSVDVVSLCWCVSVGVREIPSPVIFHLVHVRGGLVGRASGCLGPFSTTLPNWAGDALSHFHSGR